MLIIINLRIINLLKLYLFFIIIFSIFLAGPVFAAKLKVPDSLIGKRTLYLVPLESPPNTCDAAAEGQIYFDTDNQVYYCDGTSAWKPIKSQPGTSKDTAVSTRIVAAKDSLDSYEDPPGSGIWKNDRADYTCDGTDDQQMINKAINDLASGGAVYLLEGAYNISSVLLEGETLPGIVPHSNTSIIGAGSATRLQGTSGVIINASGVWGILISQLMIRTNAIGVSFNNVTDSKIDTIWVDKLSSAEAKGIVLKDSSGNIISGSYLYNGVGDYGIVLNQNSIGNIISGNYIGCGGDKSIYSEGVVNYRNSGNIISDNIISSGNTSIYLSYSENNTFSGNILKGYICLQYLANNNTFSGNNSYLFQQTHMLNSSNNNTFSGNSFYLKDITGSVLMVSGSHANNFTGNNFYIDSMYIYDNTIILAQSNANLISSNAIVNGNGVANWGIKIGHVGVSCSALNSLVGNLIEGFGKPVILEKTVSCPNTKTKFMQKEMVTLERKIPDYAAALNNSNRNTLKFVGQTCPTAANCPPVPAPFSYIPITGFNMAATLGQVDGVAIEDGKHTGDLLILEGYWYNGDYPVTIPNNKNTRLDAPIRVVGYLDTLTLIWDGFDWVEIGYANNNPAN